MFEQSIVDSELCQMNPLSNGLKLQRVHKNLAIQQIGSICVHIREIISISVSYEEVIYIQAALINSTLEGSLINDVKIPADISRLDAKKGIFDDNLMLSYDHELCTSLTDGTVLLLNNFVV